MTQSPAPFLASYPLVISTLSPVHLGCAEDYEPTNYIIDQDQLYGFRTTELAGLLSESQRQKLSTIVNGRDPLLGVQKFIHQLGEELLPIVDNTVSVSPGCRERYQQRIGQAAALGGREESKVVNKLAIPRTAYNPNSHRPLLTGTALKGAIRTALLNYQQARNPAQRQQARKEQEREIQKKLLGGGFAEDPMRLIKLSDAVFHDGEAVLHNRVIWACNIKKQRQADSKPKADLSVMREVVSAMNSTCFHGELRLESLPNIRAGKNVPHTSFDIMEIIDACNSFYRPLSDKELALLRRLGCLNPRWDKALEAMQTHLDALFSRRRAMLLRVGRHSGAEAVTIDGLRNITIPQKKNRQEKYGNTEATTVWLAGDSDKASGELLPFGWLLVELETDEPDHTNLAVKQQMGQYNATAYEQQQKTAGTLREKQRKVAEKKAKRVQAEQERKQELQAEAVRAEQELQRRAALSEEQRQIEIVRDMALDPKAAGSFPRNQDFAVKLAQVVEAAVDWPVADRAELVAAARKALGHFGINLKKNKKWKERLRTLSTDS